MTVLPDARAARCAARLVEPGRVIAVGVRDHAYDGATLAWAQAQACAGSDSLHLVHAYVPLRLDGRQWDPVRREGDARALLGRRISAQAVQRVRAVRPDVLVDGCAVQGLPVDVLQEFSAVADLLVVGEHIAGPERVRTIAWQLQDHAQCPVVTVPRGFIALADKPVTVVLAGSDTSEPVLRFAASAARRQHVALEVSSEHELDPNRLAVGSSLLVAGRDTAARFRAGLPALDCPMAVVPVTRRPV